MRVFAFSRTNIWIVGSLLLLLTGCGRQSTRVAEKPIDDHVSASKTAPLTSSVPSAPPTPLEVQHAVARVLGTNVVMLEGKPVTLTGDFNGDTYSDLVIAVKPVPKKLNEINAELANWQIQDPRHTYVPPKNATTGALPKVPKAEKVKSGEALLVVIHGDGALGWRDPLAIQTYLLREMMGESFEVTKPSKALIRDFGQFPSVRDVISENLQGKRGVIYWTGAAYAWHAEEQDVRSKPRTHRRHKSAEIQSTSLSMSFPAGSGR